MEIALEQGVVPKALENCPVLMPGLGFYLTAYDELCHDRPIGMALGSIPYSSIITWAKHNYVTDPDDIATIEHYIRAMERTVNNLTNPK